MISPQFYPIVGGYERSAERLAEALTRQGHFVTVVSERRNPEWPVEEYRGGVFVRRLWCKYVPGLHVITSFLRYGLFLLFNGRGFQVWHIHQIGMIAALGVALGKMMRRPVVIKLTSTGPQGIASVIQNARFSVLVKWFMCKADAVIASTRKTREAAILFGIPAERVSVLGNGIPVDVFEYYDQNQKMHVRHEMGIEATGMAIFVGRLSDEKNLEGLLAAWQMALPRMPGGWKLILVGEGPMHGTLQSRIRSMGLFESVFLVGEKEDVEKWLKASDIFVLASHYEGLSNSVLEAMASGLPVVSTRVSGSNESVVESNAGIVVDVGQMEQLSEAIVRLAVKPELRLQMGKNARIAVIKKYSIGEITHRYETLYHGLLNNHNQQSH